MESRLMKHSIWITLSLLLFACNSNDCGFPLDQIRFADKAEADGEKFYLYTRTVGWQNKTIFFELYNTEPSFDECRQTKTNFLFKTPYDDYPEMQYVKEMILQPMQAEKLKIIYTQNIEEGVANVYDVKFTNN